MGFEVEELWNLRWRKQRRECVIVDVCSRFRCEGRGKEGAGWCACVRARARMYVWGCLSRREPLALRQTEGTERRAQRAGRRGQGAEGRGQRAEGRAQGAERRAQRVGGGQGVRHVCPLSPALSLPFHAPCSLPLSPKSLFLLLKPPTPLSAESVIMFGETRFVIREPLSVDRVTRVAIPVVRVGDTSHPAVVRVYTRDGTARAAKDYIGFSKGME